MNDTCAANESDGTVTRVNDAAAATESYWVAARMNE
jgi:hypothetical protein